MNWGPVVNSEYDDQLPSISSDGLELYFMSRPPGGVGDWDIWVAQRETIHDPWGQPMNIGPTVNSSGEDWAPCISADGLELYFEANRTGGYGDTDILVAVRETTDEPWGDPVNLGPTVNSSSRDGGRASPVTDWSYTSSPPDRVGMGAVIYGRQSRCRNDSDYCSSLLSLRVSIVASMNINNIQNENSRRIAELGRDGRVCRGSGTESGRPKSMWAE